MFKEKFIQLCNQKGESPSKVCECVGITRSSYSAWTDESVPRKATLMRIADYFGVTVDHLLGKEDAPVTESSLSDAEKTLVDAFSKLSAEDRSEVLLDIIARLNGSK